MKIVGSAKEIERFTKFAVAKAIDDVTRVSILYVDGRPCEAEIYFHGEKIDLVVEGNYCAT